MISKSIPVASNGIIPFFFRNEQYSIICVYVIFFIHFSINGHLLFFHVLAIANSAAMNTGVNVSFQLLVFSGCIPMSGITDHVLAISLAFSGISILFSIVTVQIYIPSDSIEGFAFLHTLSSIYCL